MQKLVLTTIMLFSLASFAVDQFKKIGVNDLDQMLANKKVKIYLYDANVASTRKNAGIIPGAVLIDSSDQFDLKKALPTDTNSQLVFYCANQMCTASHDAADRAIKLGYKNVSVMIDGVYGWQKAGKSLVLVKDVTAGQGVLPAKEAIEVSPQVANAKVQKQQAVIVDVRESEERHEVIEGALWFPTSKANNPEEWNHFVASLPKSKQIIFHCAVGARSKKMAERLAKEGHSAGYFKSTDQWHEAGLPLKSQVTK